jgi:hypothetical protein
VGSERQATGDWVCCVCAGSKSKPTGTIPPATEVPSVGRSLGRPRLRRGRRILRSPSTLSRSCGRHSGGLLAWGHGARTVTFNRRDVNAIVKARPGWPLAPLSGTVARCPGHPDGAGTKPPSSPARSRGAAGSADGGSEPRGRAAGGPDRKLDLETIPPRANLRELPRTNLSAIANPGAARSRCMQAAPGGGRRVRGSGPKFCRLTPQDEILTLPRAAVGYSGASAFCGSRPFSLGTGPTCQ